MKHNKNYTALTWIKFIGLSSIGIFMFFVPIEISDKTTIPLDHIVSFLRNSAESIVPYYTLVIIFLGALQPFYNKTWNKNSTSTIFSLFKLAGLLVGIMAITMRTPAFLFTKDMIPFLYNKLVISVGLIVPVGSLFLSFIIGYGLLEYVGVIMQPIMKIIWKVPGKSAIDAVASFVGSYSIGLLITDRVYKNGGYTTKEAAIIATGFSTVSITFMVIVAKTLGLIHVWSFYFWTTFLITFLVTAITVRIYPLSRMSNSTYDIKKKDNNKHTQGIFQRALRAGLDSCVKSQNIRYNIIKSFTEGLKMTMSILPSILSIGLLGLTVAKFTPLFDYCSYIFYPLTLLLRLPEPLLVAKASMVGIAEMFLPALLVKESQLFAMKYVVGVVSVSSILFLSASIPCIISTAIPIKIRDIIIIWFERTVLSLVLATIFAQFL